MEKKVIEKIQKKREKEIGWINGWISLSIIKMKIGNDVNGEMFTYRKYADGTSVILKGGINK